MGSNLISLSEAIKGSEILQLGFSDLDSLSADDFVLDGDCPAFVIGFISPGLDIDSAAKTIKEHCRCELVLTQTAGELSSKSDDFYLEADDQRDSVILQLVSKAVLDSVCVCTVKLPCQDILEGKPIVSASERVDAIRRELMDIELPFKLEAQDTVALTLINGLTNCENWFMEAAYQTGRFPIPFIGGTTAGKLDFKNASYHDGHALRDAHATICFLKLNSYFRFRTFMSQNFEPAGMQWIVGHSDVAKRTVSGFIDRKTLQSENIFDSLCAHFQCSELHLEQALKGYSFAIKVESDFYIRSVAALDYETRSLQFYCDIPLGTELYLMRSTDFVEKTKLDFETFLKRGESPKFGIFFDCILRRLNNKDKLKSLTCFNDYPVAGFSTFGELFGVNVNETLSALFVCERDPMKVGSISDFAANYAGYSRYFNLLKMRADQLLIDIQERIILGQADVLSSANNTTSLAAGASEKVASVANELTELVNRFKLLAAESEAALGEELKTGAEVRSLINEIERLSFDAGQASESLSAAAENAVRLQAINETNREHSAVADTIRSQL